jgi:methionyl aminopeptidase
MEGLDTIIGNPDAAKGREWRIGMVARSGRQRRRLREANEATACLLRELAQRAHPGTTTGQLDEYAVRTIRRLGAEPVFATQNGFPACINTSVNDEAVHGVPGDRVLQTGDLLKIDCGIRLNGYCGDTTITVGVGGTEALSRERRHVMSVADEALRLGIAAVRVGGHLGDIGHAMQTYVEGQGCRLLSRYGGHGLGSQLWEPPHVPSVGARGSGPVIEEGLVFTIEPIVVGGSERTYVARDGWTVITADGKPAAQFEHTVMATRSGATVLSVCG